MALKHLLVLDHSGFKHIFISLTSFMSEYCTILPSYIHISVNGVTKIPSWIMRSEFYYCAVPGKSFLSGQKFAAGVMNALTGDDEASHI
jgi:hypothetical protein